MYDLSQILIEVLLQFLFQGLANFIWRRLGEPARTVVKALLFIGAGVILGGVSSVIVRKPLLSMEWLRVAYLIVAPVLMGLAMSLIGHCYAKRNLPTSSLERFGFAWLFAFSFALARYLCT